MRQTVIDYEQSHETEKHSQPVDSRENQVQFVAIRDPPCVVDRAQHRPETFFELL